MVWATYRPRRTGCTEREQLIAANEAFAAALKRALQSGAETSVGVLATVIPKRGKNGTASGFAARRRVETIGADPGRYRTEDAARQRPNSSSRPSYVIALYPQTTRNRPPQFRWRLTPARCGYVPANGSYDASIAL